MNALTTNQIETLVDLTNPDAVFEVNNSAHPDVHSYWQRITQVDLTCDEDSAGDYDCDGDCVVTLHLVPPEDGAAEVWHMTAEHAATAQFRRVR